jgi:proton glutamate symport protein
MVGVLVILSKGMAGVASASIVVLIAAGNSIGLPAEGIALLLGVDFIVDMARTGVNVIGNSLAAAVIDSSEKRREAARDGRGEPDAPTDSDEATAPGTPAGPDVPADPGGPSGADTSVDPGSAFGHESPVAPGSPPASDGPAEPRHMGLRKEAAQ